MILRAGRRLHRRATRDCRRTKSTPRSGHAGDHKLTEAFSLVIDCADQGDVDHYWDALVDGGEPGACGWLKDRYGVSWQVVPRALPELLSASDPEKAQRAMTAMLSMSKLDIDALRRAAERS